MTQRLNFLFLITDQQRAPLWSIPLMFFGLIFLKASEWLLRRRWGRICDEV